MYWIKCILTYVKSIQCSWKKYGYIYLNACVHTHTGHYIHTYIHYTCTHTSNRIGVNVIETTKIHPIPLKNLVVHIYIQRIHTFIYTKNNYSTKLGLHSQVIPMDIQPHKNLELKFKPPIKIIFVIKKIARTLLNHTNCMKRR